MRSLFLCLLLSSSYLLSAQCFFDPSTGQFLNLDGTPCFLSGPPVAVPFIGFGNNELTQSVNEIRVVAPEEDAIINTDQNPSLLRQPRSYSSVQLSVVPWQTARTFDERNTALKTAVQNQTDRMGSWSFRYENYNFSSLFLRSSNNLLSFRGQHQSFRLACAIS